MGVNYPLSLPATPVPRQSTFRLRRVVAVGFSPFNLTQQVHQHQGEQWQAELAYPPMRRAVFAPLQATLIKLRGRRGTFLVGDFDARTPLGVATGAPQVNNAAGSPTVNLKGACELVTDNWNSGITGIMKAGDGFQLGSGANAELYMVVDDADSDGGGNATLNIEPALRSDAVNNGVIVTSAPKGVFRLVSNITEWDANAASIYGVSFAIEEVL